MLRITVTGEDSALASALGSVGGVLRDAEVTIERAGSAASRQTARTDSAGTVGFTRLLPGTYGISVLRVLTSAEVARLGTANADVTAFGGGVSVTVSPPSTAAAVVAVGGRRGSLVIAEIFAAAPRLSSGGWYLFGSFIELYNNADTTIYLDGKVISRSISWLSDYESPLSCAEMQGWREDPNGIWTAFIYAFPGSGRSYPLAPGQAVVVATDAIDHRPFVASLHDLSGADFEFIGSSDVDNPSVPNMRNIGLREWNPVLGHGLIFVAFQNVWVVADSLEVSSLPRDNLPVQSPLHLRIPRDRVLDIVSLALKPAIQATLTALCPRLVHENFDRRQADLLDGDVLDGIQRRVFTTLPGGRVILQRTKTSARDFLARSPATPGGVP